MQTSGSSANWRSRLVGGVRAPMVRSGVEARLAGMPGQGTAPTQPGRGLAQGVTALSPRRQSAPAASPQAPGLTPTPSSGSRPAEGQDSSTARAPAPGAATRKLGRRKRDAHGSASQSAGANGSPGLRRTRPARRPRARPSHGPAQGWDSRQGGLAASLTLVVARWPPSLPRAFSLACNKV